MTETMVVLLILGGSGSAGLAAGALQGEPVRIRAVGALLGLWWFAATAFVLFVGAGPVAAAVFGAVSFVVALRTSGARQLWWEAWRTLVRDVGRGLAGTVAGLHWFERLGVVAVAGVAVLRILRGVLAPPLAWDALTYHLPRAVGWLHGAGFDGEVAIGALDYYRLLPPGGDMPWTWALLVDPSGLVLPLVGGAIWFAATGTAFALGRSWGMTQGRALVAAVAVTGLPCLLGFVTACYVHGAMVAALLGGLACLAEGDGASSPRRDLAAVAAFGLAASLNAGGVLLAVPGLIVAGARLSTGPRAGGWRASILALGLVALVPCAPYLGTWWRHGSPLHPLPVLVAGQEVAPGHPLLRAVVEGVAREGTVPLARLLELLFITPYRPDAASCNFGWGGLALVGAIVAAMARVCRGVRGRAGLGPALVMALVVVVGLMRPEAAAFRTERWGPTVGRLMIPGLAPLVIAVAGADVSAVTHLVRLALPLNVLAAVPLGFDGGEWRSMGSAFLLPGAALVVFTALGACSGRSRLARVAAAVTVLAGGWALRGLPLRRAACRYPVYESAARELGGAFDAHPIWPPSAVSWRLWQAMDGSEGVHVAVGIGWDGVGHQAFVFPWYGSSLQNRVFVVGDGPEGVRCSDESLLALLADREVERVVLVPPASRLARLVAGMPELFRRKPMGAVDASEATVLVVNPVQLRHAADAALARARRRRGEQ